MMYKATSNSGFDSHMLTAHAEPQQHTLTAEGCKSACKNDPLTGVIGVQF